MRDIPLTAMIYIPELRPPYCNSPGCQHGDDPHFDLPGKRMRLGDFVDAVAEHLDKYEHKPVRELPDLAEDVT